MSEKLTHSNVQTAGSYISFWNIWNETQGWRALLFTCNTQTQRILPVIRHVPVGALIWISSEKPPSTHQLAQVCILAYQVYNLLLVSVRVQTFTSNLSFSQSLSPSLTPRGISSSLCTTPTVNSNWGELLGHSTRTSWSCTHLDSLIFFFVHSFCSLSAYGNQIIAYLFHQIEAIHVSEGERAEKSFYGAKCCVMLYEPHIASALRLCTQVSSGLLFSLGWIFYVCVVVKIVVMVGSRTCLLSIIQNYIY